MYASVTLQPQTTSAKMLRLNKKSFDRFTQRNIRRNLISANHVKQMKLCKDLQHIVRAEGIQIPMFHIVDIVSYPTFIQPSKVRMELCSLLQKV